MTARLGGRTFDFVDWDARGDTLYVRRGSGSGIAETLESIEGHVVDFAPDGEVVGVEFLNAAALLREGDAIAVSVPDRVEMRFSGAELRPLLTDERAAAKPVASGAAAPDRPLYRELFWPVLHAIQVLGGSANRQEVIAKAIELGGYGEDEQEELMPNGRTPRIAYYCSWTLTRLKWLGLAENSARGVWSLTERGRATREEDVPALWEEMMLGSRDRRRRRRERRDDDVTIRGEDEGGGEGDVESWKDEVIARMKSLEPAAFERLVQRLLREADFEKVQVTGRSGDQGIDGVGLVRLGLLSFPTYFQCKRYAGSVSAGAVRDFRGAMAGRGEKGVLITTGTFTPAARQEATRDGVTPIDLVDGNELCDLLLRYSLGVQVIEEVAVDEDFWLGVT